MLTHVLLTVVEEKALSSLLRRRRTPGFCKKKMIVMRVNPTDEVGT
jgi:hypothetical protein